MPTSEGTKKTATGTTYVVLTQTGEDGWYVVASDVEAASATAAVKRYMALNHEGDADAYVAVPARSWQPLKQQTTTKTITTLEAL